MTIVSTVPLWAVNILNPATVLIPFLLFNICSVLLALDLFWKRQPVSTLWLPSYHFQVSRLSLLRVTNSFNDMVILTRNQI